jgi:hypothetical protein
MEAINFLKGNRNSTVVFIWDQHGLAETCNQMTDTLPTLKKNILTGAAHGAKHSYLLYPSVAQRPSTVFDPSVTIIDTDGFSLGFKIDGDTRYIHRIVQ